MDMKDMKDPVDILEQEGTRADTIAGYMYDGNFDDPLHNYTSYLASENDYLIVHVGVDDPTRKGMFCWIVLGEVHIDDRNRLKYFVRVPPDEHHYWKDGVFHDGVKELPCPQNVEGMLETMDNYRKEFLKTGYISMLNNLNLKAINSLPG